MTFLRIKSKISMVMLLSLILLHSPLQSSQQAKSLRIVSLSPHLTEIVFELQLEKYLIAVSDYSDYPFPQGCVNKECSVKLPSVASYQGADIAEIVRLKPTHVLAWDGGNKAQDIARLEQLGYTVFRSSPNNIQALMDEISALGKLLNAEHQSLVIYQRMSSSLKEIKKEYKEHKVSAIYYMNQQPLSGIGNDPWLNSLLSLCNIQNVYEELPTSYAHLSMADIIRKQAELVIAATHQKQEEIRQFWSPHQQVYKPQIIRVNPDALHRFTPRVLPELAFLCQKVHF